MTIRAPLFSRTTPLRDSPVARIGVTLGSAVALLTAVAASPPPRAQADFPLPRKVDSPIARDFNKTNNFPLYISVKPFFATEWPMPSVGTSRDSPIARRWEQTDNVELYVSIKPFFATEWPLAVQRNTDSPLARRWERANDLGRLLSVMPFAATDWPLASRTPLAPPDTLVTPAIRTVVAVSQPFSLLDWSLPRRAPSATPEAAASNIAALSTPPPARPFALLDWSLPRSAGRLAPDAPPSNIAALSTLQAKPFAFYDWGLAQQVPGANAARDYVIQSSFVPLNPPPTPGTPGPEYVYYAMRHSIRS